MKKISYFLILLGIFLSIIISFMINFEKDSPIPTSGNQQISTSKDKNQTLSDDPVSEEVTSLPIIMYHHICTSKNALNNYTISPETFKGDLEYLRSHGYTTISVKELIAFTRGEAKLPEKPVMITFDDGYASFGAYALPLLKEYDMCAVLAVIGQIADNYTKIEDHNIRYSYFSWPELAELSKCPNVELSAHTFNMHSRDKRKGCRISKGESLASYSLAFNKDLDELENRFQDYIGEKPVAFAYPYGFCCNEAKEILRSRGYSVVFTCYEHVNKLTGDKEELLSLCRFNRPNNIDRNQFFKKLAS